ncbi:DDE superfamily endonuclease [Fragilaria crotonensis]|nr:DDE superfamily endonuclease [Fragilaria crotonensis]
MFGPITGNRHDSYMLAKSRLIAKLHEMMPPLPAPTIDGGNQHENLQKLASFHYMGIQLIPNLFSFLEDTGILAQGLKKRGEMTYPQSLLLFGGYRNPRPGSQEARWNDMSKVRDEVVEWAFANLIKNWAFLDFRASMMVFKSPVTKYYMIAAFLRNRRSCFYGNQTMQYFDCEPLRTLQQYLSLVAEPLYY